jgi:flavorubredoxin
MVLIMVNEEDSIGRILYEDADHKFIWLGTDSKNRKSEIQTMQYLIIDHNRGTLLDPGGVHIFSRVVASVSRYISIDNIDTIFYSHQDPDVSSGIALWLGVTKAKVYISGLWLRFLPHFGIVDTSRVIPVEDRGTKLTLGSGAVLDFIPAHFMHSPGQFNLYDTRSRILFSGDIGAAVFNSGDDVLFVENFAKHIPLIEAFHKRYMASNIVVKKWCDRVRALNPDMIAPQHGAIYKGETVHEFLDWLSQLKCGIDLMN